MAIEICFAFLLYLYYEKQNIVRHSGAHYKTERSDCMLNYKYLIILILSLYLIFLSSCSKSMKNKDEMYYGNSNTETTKPSVETIKYTIEENKVMTDDYSFELPEGYEVKGNENYISAGSNASGINISVDSYTDNKITLEEYVQKQKNEIYKTGYEVSEPKEIEINGMMFTELRIGMPGKSETDPIGCEYIYEGKSGIIEVSTTGNGFTAIDTAESEELVKQLNLDIK